MIFKRVANERKSSFAARFYFYDADKRLVLCYVFAESCLLYPEYLECSATVPAGCGSRRIGDDGDGMYSQYICRDGNAHSYLLHGHLPVQ